MTSPHGAARPRRSPQVPVIRHQVNDSPRGVKSMPMSNIQSVNLNEGAIKIIGEIADLETYDRKSSVLHVWLAQPGYAENAGAGLAIDCFALEPTATGDTPTFVSAGDQFRLTVPTGASIASGVVGPFFQGP